MPSHLIIGGGLAGSAAAITLASAGRHVTLLERETHPRHKVCGEFLSQEALHTLHALGIDPAALGARTIRSVRLAGARRVTAAPLPFTAMSLTRKLLDEALLQRAERCGATVLRGMRATQLQPIPRGWSVLAECGESMEADEVFLATGKHDLGGQPRPPGVQRDMVGFKMYFALLPGQAEQLAGHIELNLFRGGYAGLQLVEDGSANLGWIVRKSELQRLGGRWENVVGRMQHDCPHLAERLQGARPLLERALAVSAIPYGYVRPSAMHADHGGVWALGDQAAVIPSFTGDGMAIALHSGVLAATMHLQGETAANFQPALARQLRRQVALATLISRGLVSPRARSAMLLATQFWPRSLALIAHLTRIPRNLQKRNSCQAPAAPRN